MLTKQGHPTSMPNNAPVVVCGNAGTAGGDILRRRDIQTFWALTPAEALAAIQEARAKACLCRPEHALEILKSLPKRSEARVVVLCDGEEWKQKEALFAAGATALVQATATDRILEAVSEVTGLAFAKYPRVRIETAVEVTIDGESSLLQTVNLSASGVLIKGGETLRVGAGVRVSFLLLDPPIDLEALVVRSAHDRDGEVPLTGLCFMNVPDAIRHRLSALVEREIEADEDAALTIDVPNLEDEIARASATVSTSGEQALGELKDKLREVVTDARRDSALTTQKRSESVARIGSSLTSAERASVLGQPAPAWAQPAVDARLQLHVERKEKGKPSARTVQETLVLCRTLGQGATDRQSLAEACAVRANLLREVYSDSPRTRAGAQSPAALKPTTIEISRRKPSVRT
ncbi:MAG: PilZ domain-containing protein [Myxococcota bacterium]